MWNEIFFKFTLLYVSYLVYASYKNNCPLAYYIVHTVKTGTHITLSTKIKFIKTRLKMTFKNCSVLKCSEWIVGVSSKQMDQPQKTTILQACYSALD